MALNKMVVFNIVDSANYHFPPLPITWNHSPPMASFTIVPHTATTPTYATAPPTVKILPTAIVSHISVHPPITWRHLSAQCHLQCHLTDGTTYRHSATYHLQRHLVARQHMVPQRLSQPQRHLPQGDKYCTWNLTKYMVTHIWCCNLYLSIYHDISVM